MSVLIEVSEVGTSTKHPTATIVLRLVGELSVSIEVGEEVTSVNHPPGRNNGVARGMRTHTYIGTRSLDEEVSMWLGVHETGEEERD
jgi:hypothetical protein